MNRWVNDSRIEICIYKLLTRLFWEERYEAVVFQPLKSKTVDFAGIELSLRKVFLKSL